jgi:hypothetical protein
MTGYHHTPSSVLALEYLADVERFEGLTRLSPWEEVRLAAADSLEYGLGRNLLDWYGKEAALKYFRSLLELNAQRQRRAERAEEEARWAKRRQEREEAAKVQAARVEVVKVERPERKPWQDARRVNEYKMRDAILKVVGRHGWTSVGIRKLADLAKMPHRTARTVLARLAADGQIKLDASKERGRRTGVYVIREHPCWSDHKHAQSLALSKLSSQVRR